VCFVCKFSCKIATFAKPQNVINLKEPNDLLTALRLAINDKLTFDNLDKYLKSLSPDKDAWTMEAINSLLEMFDFESKNTFDKAIELDTIIRQLTQHYRL
jgi:hypothetical protein